METAFFALGFTFGVKGSGGIFNSRFRFSSSLESFAMSEEDLTPYYALNGRFSHFWAYMETGLAAVVTVIYHAYDGKTWLKHELPRTGYGRRAQYLRAAAHMPALKPWQSQIGALLNKTDKLAQDRHLFTHGSPTDFKVPQHLEMWFLHIDSRTGLALDKGRTVTWAELTKMSDDAAIYADQMLALASAIIKAAPNQIHQAPCKVAVQLVRLFPVLEFWRDKFREFFAPCK